MDERSFSKKVKAELSSIVNQDNINNIAQFAVAWIIAGKICDRKLLLEHLHKDDLRHFTSVLDGLFSGEVETKVNREGITLSIANCQIDETTALYLQQIFKSGKTTSYVKIADNLHPISLQSMLRAFFIISGTINEPISSYHLAFSLRRKVASDVLHDLLSRFSIHSKYLFRNGQHLIYIKDGQHISEFLLNAGAHRALLEFESLRVEKEMRNKVNRVVNCDSANTQRIANTSARQLALIKIIEQEQGIDSLSPVLAVTARMRLQNPELSLKELGEQLSPPLGKSGVNHRLKKLEFIASEIINAKTAKSSKEKQNGD